MFDDRLRATVRLQKPAVHSKHPFSNQENHDKLMEYLKARIQQGLQGRDSRLPRCVEVDRTVAGWIQLSDEDREAQEQARKDGKPKMFDVNLPISFVQLDDMMAYFVQTFAPNRGMFYQNGRPEETTPANQIVTLMNNHAVYAGYFREMTLTIFGLLKYNIGGFFAEWDTDQGPVFQSDGTTVTIPIWEGNRVKSIDIYNAFWDTQVHPIKVAQEGEYAGIVEPKGHFWLQRAGAEGRLWNLEEGLKVDAAPSAGSKWYRSPPAEAALGHERYVGTRTMVEQLVSGNGTNTGCEHELTTIWIRLNPTDFGLVEARDRTARNQLEIWKFQILDGTWVVFAEQQDNIHNMIPCFLGLAHDDQMVEGQQSVGEIISPLQDFASHLLNVHTRASRRNLWGNTYYDSKVLDFANVRPGDVARLIPTKPTAPSAVKMRDAIYHDETQIDTSRTMQDLEGVLGLINQFFPTSVAPSQIGDIDRAITSQVAAVQQGANRRNHKTATLIDSTILRPMRSALYYNIVQYQQDEAEVTDYYGRRIVIDLSQLRQTDLPFIIGQGLMMLDRQASAMALQSVIVMLIQNPIAAQQLGVGMLRLINYWISLLDLNLDLSQFMEQPGGSPQPEGAGSPEELEGQPPEGMENV